ncbi:hypothetical protein [Oceanobacter kriegii]|uniref:hypothetical protein n=1 Tax=Oceanobacter kriegii TaxID=64972 RepID=UPI000405AFAA|nr:hypothetical protein [Oceanobacter kriegii]
MNWLLAIAKPILSALTKDLIIDTVQAVFGRIQWAVVLERLLTRLMISFLRWIQRLSTNDVVDETVELIASMLEEKRLAKAKEYQKAINRKPQTAAKANKDL